MDGTVGVPVCGAASLGSAFFGRPGRDVSGFLADFFAAAFLVVAFCRTATFEGVFFTAAAVLLEATGFARAFLSGFEFVAAEAFVPACFDPVGRFATGEALAEVFAGDVTLAAFLMDEPLEAGVAASVPCCRAQRARCAAAILAFPSGLMARRFGKLNSLALKLVTLFLEPCGRPRPGEVLGSARSVEEPVLFSPPSRLRTCLRRAISPSIVERMSVVFIPNRIRDLKRR